jgi:RHS repeat-associated protein
MSVCNVNIGSGDVYHYSVDLFLRGFIPFRFIRDYDSGRNQNSPVGQRWKHNLSHLLLLREKHAVYIAPDGSETEVPHPDYPAADQSMLALKTQRQENAVLLSDLRDNVYRFETLESTSNLLYITAHIDPRGNRLEYKYYPDGVLQSVKDTYGRLIVFTTNTLGYILRISAHLPQEQSSLRELVRYEYDLAGDLRMVYDSNGGVNEFKYERHFLVEHINPLGGRTYFKYDAKGRCIHTSREDGTHERKLFWDDNRHSVEVWDSRGGMWLYAYNDRKQPLVEVDPLGNRKEYFYDDKGNLEFVSDENTAQSVTLFFEDRRLLINQTGSITSTVQYDEKMRVVEELNASGSKWSYKYDDYSNRVEIVDPREFVWKFEYDSDGWLGAVLDPRGFQLTRQRKNRSEVEYRDEIGLRAILHHSPFGLPVAAVDGLGHATRYEYTLTDLLTAIHYTDGSSVRFEYDAMGNMILLQRESGAATTFKYNKFGVPLSVTNPLGRRATLHYDSEENLVEVRNFSGEVAKFQFDLMNRMTDAVLFDGRIHRYTLDSHGNVTRVHDQNQILLLDIQRDELGRIVKKIFPDAWEVTYEWGDQNQLLAAKNPHTTLRFEWTQDMRLAAEHVNDFSIFYEYDEVGNRKSLTTSSGRQIEYVWDVRNRLTKIEDCDRAQYHFSYDGANLFNEWICPAVVQHYTFDARQRMVRREALDRGTLTAIADRSFEYDVGGRLVVMRDQMRGLFRYRYSDLDEILEVQNGQIGTSETYAFDANENLTQSRNGQIITYGPGNRLRRVGDRMFDHDSNGAVTRITEGQNEWSFAYNPEGRLSRVRTPGGKTIEYYYDPLGRRIRKIVDGMATNFFWDQGSLLAEVLPSTETVDYLFLPGTFLPLGMTDGSGHYSFVLDQAGTPTEVVDPMGQVAWSGDYTAFGEVVAERGGQIRNPFRFQGQYFDEETGFHYNFFRYYYPLCARYLTQDPLGLEAGANLYRYVLNPFNWVDPTGLCNIVNGVLTIIPICGWSEDQEADARKKMAAMNDKLDKMGGAKIEKGKHKRCGETAKKIYEDCQKERKAEREEAKKNGKDDPLPDLSEGGGKCHNQQADHMLEICIAGGETDCNNLQPLNESVNKSFGSQVGATVRSAENQGKVLTKIKISKDECRDRPSVQC